MFKPAPNVDGCLTVSVGIVDNIFQVSGSLYAYLLSVLGSSGVDHTYLKVGTAPVCEYVKVTQVHPSGYLVVNRAEDGTAALSFPATTPLEYVLAAAAVEDMLAGAVASSDVSIVASYPLQVAEETTNNFTISLDPLSIASSDGTIDVMGEWPNINLAVVRGVNGCGC